MKQSIDKLIELLIGIWQEGAPLQMPLRDFQGHIKINIGASPVTVKNYVTLSNDFYLIKSSGYANVDFNWKVIADLCQKRAKFISDKSVLQGITDLNASFEVTGEIKPI